MNSLKLAYMQQYGSRASFAAALGVTAEAVRKWERTRVPAERCLEIEKLCNGLVTRYDLRQDVFGPPSPSFGRRAGDTSAPDQAA